MLSRLARPRRGAAREMMCYRARRFEDPRDRVREAREFLRFQASSVREPQACLSRILAEEADLLDRLPDDYLYHEHLDEVNQPVYFHQFVDHAAAHGLRYLWESYVGELGGDLPPRAVALAPGRPRDVLAEGLGEEGDLEAPDRVRPLSTSRLASTARFSSDLHVLAPVGRQRNAALYPYDLQKGRASFLKSPEIPLFSSTGCQLCWS